ncbi:alanine acetyltransferase [Pseudoxanthomonas beigongshangi]
MSFSAQTPWSPEQQGWLAALGYTVWVTGASAPAEPELAESPLGAAERAPAPDTMPRAEHPKPSASREPAATRVAPTLDAESSPSPERPRAAPPRSRPGSRLPDRLHFALIRASGCNPNAEGAAEIFAQWPASSELRGNPAAKRALWPRLRALRRPAAQ